MLCQQQNAHISSENDGIDKADEGYCDKECILQSKDVLNDVRTNSRPKVQMDRLKNYRHQLFEEDFKAAYPVCTKQLHRIQSLLTDQNQIHVSQRERGKLEARMDDFASAHEVLYDTFETEERIKHNARYDDLNARNRDRCC